MIEYIIKCNILINHCSKRRGCEQQYETWERPVGWQELQVCSRYVMEIVHYDGKCIDFDAIF